MKILPHSTVYRIRSEICVKNSDCTCVRSGHSRWLFSCSLYISCLTSPCFTSILRTRLTIKKAECWRIDAFELWCWRRLLRVSWTKRRSNKSILKEINTEYSLEGLMLKLKRQHFGHLMGRANSLERTLMLGKIQGKRKRKHRGRDGWWHQQLNGHEFEQALGGGEGQGSLACCSSWGRKVWDTTEWLNNNTWHTPIHKPQAPASDCSYQRGSEGHLLVSW